ncbi:MAG: acyltransferase family protein [Bryobacterales bacterium]
MLPWLSNWIHWTDYSRILFGCLLALSLSEERTYGWLRWAAKPVGLVLGLVMFAATHFATSHAYLQSETPAEGLYTIAIGLVIVGLVMSQPPWASFLSSRAMVFVGKRSYGIYLIHIFCIWLVEIAFPSGSGELLISIGAYVSAVLVSLVVADVLYRVVEYPGIIIGRKLSVEVISRSSSHNLIEARN